MTRVSLPLALRGPTVLVPGGKVAALLLAAGVWRRPLELGCCAPLACLSGQPGAGDGGRDETYCSYLEHAPQLAAASKKPKKSSGSQTGAHLLTFPRRFGQGPLLLLFGV